MNATFSLVRRLSTLAVVASIALSLIFRASLGSEHMGWQVVLALIALGVGIPHGAVDHLITIPRQTKSHFYRFIALYVSAALIAAIAILKWNVLGFEIVVVMSALHFGFGDAAFLAESGEKKMNRATEISYALAAGSLPVVLPLVNGKSTSALEQVNHHLINWTHGNSQLLETIVWALTALATLLLAIHGRWRELSDLAALAALAVIAPPLVAFAVYFGCWHASRHTARLTLLLKPSSTPLWSAFKAGLPALLGTLLIAVGIAIFSKSGFSSTLLWSLLVVIWALTVPHMITTARFDIRSLK